MRSHGATPRLATTPPPQPASDDMGRTQGLVAWRHGHAEARDTARAGRGSADTTHARDPGARGSRHPASAPRRHSSTGQPTRQGGVDWCGSAAAARQYHTLRQRTSRWTSAARAAKAAAPHATGAAAEPVRASAGADRARARIACDAMTPDARSGARPYADSMVAGRGGRYTRHLGARVGSRATLELPRPAGAASRVLCTCQCAYLHPHAACSATVCVRVEAEAGVAAPAVCGRQPPDSYSARHVGGLRPSAGVQRPRRGRLREPSTVWRESVECVVFAGMCGAAGKCQWGAQECGLRACAYSAREQQAAQNPNKNHEN